MEEQFSRIINMLEADIGCRLKDISVPFSRTFVFHSHDGAELFLLQKGTGIFYMEGASKEAQDGDLFLIQPYAFHFFSQAIRTAMTVLF